ncbi:MAG: lysozyme inhibitor LprI family protein [Eubacteriales bacterium]|nr:lysozyme inhibitor LprI family protein [Eubacteriales bacterium]
MKNHTKRAVIGLICLLSAAMAVLFFIGNPVVFRNNRKLAKSVKSVNSDTVFLNDIVPFVWDTLYTFGPYQSKKEIEEIIGFSSVDIRENDINEGMVHLLFVNGDRVAASVLGYSSKLGYAIDFTSKITYDENARFHVAKIDGIQTLTYQREYLPQPVYPLEASELEKAVGDAGLAWTIAKEEQWEGNRTVFTMQDEGGQIKAFILSTEDDKKRRLHMSFMPSANDKYGVGSSIGKGEWKQVMGLASLLAGGCEHQDQLYEEFTETYEQDAVKNQVQDEPGKARAYHTTICWSREIGENQCRIDLGQQKDDGGQTDLVAITMEAVEESRSSQSAKESLPFANFANVSFTFESGAGGWQTQLRIDSHGEFSGVYYDSDMGDAGDGYSNGTRYQCDFSGTFLEPVQVNAYTYSMQIQDIRYEKEPGTEEIVNEMRFCYTEAYGLAGTEEILIYLPGAPLAELPEAYRSWVGFYDLSQTEETKLPFWGLYNAARECGFRGYDIIKRTKELVSCQENLAASLEKTLENEPLSQTDYNKKSYELYSTWDYALNSIWDALKQILEEEEMASLTIEEREWINRKDQAVQEEAAEFEGGSMQPMVRNLKAAELTKARVYELLELLEKEQQ